MIARLAALVAALVALPACSAALDFNQCSADDECGVRFGAGYCTADHICVSNFPADRIVCELSEASSPDPGAVTVAALLRRTDPTNQDAVTDLDLELGIELAVFELNSQIDRKLRLVLCDTQGDSVVAKSALIVAAERYGAVAAVGPTSSGEVVALAEQPDVLVAQHDVLIVSPSATAPRVTSLSDSNLVWRTAVSDNLQAQVLATLVPPDTTKAASAYIDSTYGVGLNGAFANALNARFNNAVDYAPMSFATGTDGHALVSFFQPLAPQVALIVADSDAPNWIAALNDGGGPLDYTKYLLTDGSKAPSLFSMMPSTSVLSRILGTAPATPTGPVFFAFQSSYKGRYQGRDPSATAFVANAYDAMYAIAIAMGSVPPGGKVTGRGLIAGMQSLSDPDAPTFKVGPVDVSAAYQRLADGGTVNLEGTSGPIDFDPDTGDTLSAPIEVWDIDTSSATPVFRTLQNITP